MTRKEALQRFMETYVAAQSAKSLQALDAYYYANREQLTEGFVQAFSKLCNKISQTQARGRKGKIAYIYCSFLYTSLYEDPGRYRIDAYDQEWFFDKAECAVSYDAHWAYSFLHDLSGKLNLERKKYVGRITVYDIDLIKRAEAAKYGEYVEALAMQAINQVVQSPEFAAIDKEDTLDIFIGEYKDECQRLYRYDSNAKEQCLIKEDGIDGILSAHQR